ncbi:zinc-binding dehydrogenase [Naumannella sp. ID2617S]|nr:zinc-binding dehydrogenase [Enemella dayhoffiae]NNG19517.1 zinc-binding dehydrogenase [Naumannella sp. ID2617S]
MAESMKTFSLQAPMRFAVDEVAKPQQSELGPGDVLLKMITGGICGSDIPYFRGNIGDRVAGGRDFGKANEGFISTPGTPMHEILGEVVATRDPHHQVGDRVVGWSLNYQGLRPYVITPGHEVVRYDERWTPDVAINLQPLACVLYAVQRLGDVRGKRVAVLGQGPIGLMFARLLKEAGAAHVTGIDPIDHSAAAEAFGVEEFLQVNSHYWAARLGDADRPDLIVEAVGHNSYTLNDAITAVASGGTIFGFGVPDDPSQSLNFFDFLHKDLTLISGLTRDHQNMLRKADAYLQNDPKLASVLTTDKFAMDDLEQVQTAYDRANAAQTGRLKVVLSR